MPSENVGECGCRLKPTREGFKMVECALHKSAPNMKTALQLILCHLSLAEKQGIEISGYLRLAKDAAEDAIAETEGRKGECR